VKLTFAELPLTTVGPSLFGCSIKGRDFRFRFAYANTEGGGWYVDIGDGESVPLICGQPLTTGLNLLGQFGYLELGFGLYVSVDGKGDEAPTYEDMGRGLHVKVVTVQ
jgi:hypothetical protein